MMTSRNFPNVNIPKVQKDVFVRYFMSYAQHYMYQSGNTGEYIIDDYNRDILNNMYMWLNRDPLCKWNPDKGIYLCGAIGCGKTILMKAFLEVLMAASGYYIPFIQAPSLYEKIQVDGMRSMRMCPLFLDELGREQLEIYVNGVRIRPIEDLMAMRYEYGACTFFTSNFKIETLSQGYDEKGKKIGYGEYIGERFKEMCNIVVYPGKSRR